MSNVKTIASKADGYNEVFRSGGNCDPAVEMVLAGVDVSQFYEDNAIARRIVDCIPEEMVSPGFQVEGVGDEKAFRSLWDELSMSEGIIDALCWSRLFGGSAMMVMVPDGRALTSPAVKERGIEGYRVYDKNQITIKRRYQNPRKSNYGKPEIYTIRPGGDIREFDVHESRLYVLNGERVTNRKRLSNLGWGAGVLNKSLVRSIIDYEYCEELATQLLRRKQQAVWKANGLAQLCDDNEGAYAARIRLAQVDDNSGVGRAIGIDSQDEEYEVLNSDVSGVAEFLDKKFDRIVALSGIHEIILKNKNVGGVSASQNTALETFYKLISRKRQEDYKPLLEFLLSFMLKEEEWSVTFNPLAVPSDKDNSEILNKNVDSVVKLMADQAIDAEEARDTLRAICPQLKLKDGAMKLPDTQQNELEPEPELNNTQSEQEPE